MLKHYGIKRIAAFYKFGYFCLYCMLSVVNLKSNSYLSLQCLVFLCVDVLPLVRWHPVESGVVKSNNQQLSYKQVVGELRKLHFGISSFFFEATSTSCQQRQQHSATADSQKGGSTRISRVFAHIIAIQTRLRGLLCNQCAKSSATEMESARKRYTQITVHYTYGTPAETMQLSIVWDTMPYAYACTICECAMNRNA